MIKIEVFVENRYRHAFDNAIKKLDVKANIICEKETQTKGLGSYVNIRMSDPIDAYMLGRYYGQEIKQI